MEAVKETGTLKRQVGEKRALFKSFSLMIILNRLER
jgi:hypothetical protein